ncbi:zinc finger and BTB domain-containing protein 11-like [Salvia splendens]|uniref:zinc finger and BTB domain-containing protein 11-like n=1 Tax=Salvia splendens TaxID=180675 RepID=UPI001C27F55E|nr:zinc finger and BTB domain-containing protein 11-like [Salvia splendens]
MVQAPETVGGIISTLVVVPDLRGRIVGAQRRDEALEKLRLKLRMSKRENYQEEADNALMFEERLCVHNQEELRNELMSEAHDTPYTAHTGSTKMYQDLNKKFWWDSMKRDITSYVERCIACQQVKALHQ